MIEDQVLNKLRYLPQAQQLEVLDFVEFLVAKLAMKKTDSADIKKQKLAIAAQTLLADYESDEELTAFAVLNRIFGK